MEDINLLLQHPQQVVYVVSGLILLIFILAAFYINLLLKVNKLQRLYRQMMQGATGTSLEEMLLTHVREVKGTVAAVERLQSEMGRLEVALRSCLQKAGLVRFNAFEDTGSDLSFSLALLDGHNNGIVMSSLYGRNESRMYAKPVVNLQSTYVLSMEEQKAIQLAKAAVSSAAASG